MTTDAAMLRLALIAELRAGLSETPARTAELLGLSLGGTLYRKGTYVQSFYIEPEPA